MKSNWPPGVQRGFTIIEVIIVLAIAGLILTIVFLTVPHLMAEQRDNNRKHQMAFVSSQMEQYKADHGKYPFSAVDACTFLTGYVADRANPAQGVCNPTFGGSVCVHMTIGRNDYCYFSTNVPHDYLGPIGDIDIALSHWCNTDPVKFNEPADDVITNGNLYYYDTDISHFVVWAAQEDTRSTCLDNFQRDQ